MTPVPSKPVSKLNPHTDGIHSRKALAPRQTETGCGVVGLSYVMEQKSMRQCISSSWPWRVPLPLKAPQVHQPFHRFCTLLSPQSSTRGTRSEV
uniref:Uncharacterized protein n=1 Tax=Eutreptiella gymnastica TaxID=73025 RepID=A0A7S1IP14_9EUGL